MGFPNCRCAIWLPECVSNASVSEVSCDQVSIIFTCCYCMYERIEIGYLVYITTCGIFNWCFRDLKQFTTNVFKSRI